MKYMLLLSVLLSGCMSLNKVLPVKKEVTIDYGARRLGKVLTVHEWYKLNETGIKVKKSMTFDEMMCDINERIVDKKKSLQDDLEIKGMLSKAMQRKL